MTAGGGPVPTSAHARPHALTSRFTRSVRSRLCDVRDHGRPDGVGVPVRERFARGLRAGADGRGAIGRGPLRAPPAAVRALRAAPARGGLRVVPHDPRQRAGRHALQHRADLVLGVRAAAPVPAAGVPDRPARQPAGPGAGLDRRPARADALPADRPAGRAVSGAHSGRELRSRLSRERVHAQRIGAGVHRGPRAPAEGDHHDRPLRGGRRAARAAHSRREPDDAPRPRARARRGVVPLRGLLRAPPGSDGRPRVRASSRRRCGS